MIAIPKKASTLILLRESESAGMEVFLLKRHEKSSFMGGNYVYPGGRIDPNDHDLGICPYTRGISPPEAQRVLGGALSPEESLACWVSGVRELFEEAGVFLACNHYGVLLTLRNPEEKKRFSDYRESVQKGSITLGQLAQKEKILIALDQLHFYAHWITPEARPQRFDTYFFIARHPEGQEATPDQKETTAGIWIAPREALKENLTGEVILSPPTLKTIEDLSRYKTADEVLNSLKDREIRPTLPILIKVSGEPVLIFPWDPEYERIQRGEKPDPMAHGRCSSPEDNSTRLIQRDGRWHPYCKPQSA